MQPILKLIILGRDGILNEFHEEHIKAPEEWVALPGALEAVARLNQFRDCLVELRDSATRYPPKMRQAVEELLRVDGGPEDFEARAALATPATRLGLGRPPPILLVHGDADTVVPIDDSRSFKRALDAHGVPSLLVEVHDQGHGFAVLARKEPLLPATCTAWAFLDRVAARRP